MPEVSEFVLRGVYVMLSRRVAVAGGALSIVFAFTTGARSFAQPGRHNPIYGCTLPHNEVAGFFNGATEARFYVTGDEPMIPKSGDREFDYALAQTLAKISQALDVSPGFAYYDDYESANA
jgi:hypothetical protein